MIGFRAKCSPPALHARKAHQSSGESTLALSATAFSYPRARRKSHSELSAGFRAKSKAAPKLDPFDVRRDKVLSGKLKSLLSSFR
jgi:hypothetical protein